MKAHKRVPVQGMAYVLQHYVLVAVILVILAGLAAGCAPTLAKEDSGKPVPTASSALKGFQSAFSPTHIPTIALTTFPAHVPTISVPVYVPPNPLKPYKKSLTNRGNNRDESVAIGSDGKPVTQVAAGESVPAYVSRYTYVPPSSGQVPQLFRYNPSPSLWVSAVQSAQLQYQISNAMRYPQYASPINTGNYLYTSPTMIRQPMYFQGPGIPYANPSYIPPITRTIPGSGYTSPITTLPGSGYTNPITMPRIYNPPAFNPPVYIPPPAVHFP